MNRWFLYVALALISALGFAADKPNVLFIAVDDLNDFPSYAKCYPDAKTPNMDRLAARGVAFTRAYSNFPLCGPSRASLMSGMYPATLGFDDHMSDEALQKRTRAVGTELLHSYFGQQGYKTLAVGKICHHHVPKGSVDESGGRGEFNGGTGNLGKNWKQAGTSTDWAMAPEKDEQLPDHQAATWAVEQLGKPYDKPFFLAVGFMRPHVPWYVPKKWFDLYDKDKITLPPYKKEDLDDLPPISRKINILSQMPTTDWAIENNKWRDIVQAYLACVSFADYEVGRVLDALEKSPYKDNTIIVLWSDHGYHMGEKNTFQKQSLWERSAHVPLIFAGPNIQPNRRCDRVVSLLDIYPTLVDLCGLKPNAKNEGRSVTPLLRDPAAEWPYPAITGWKENSFAVQSERYRYIRYSDGSEELYDHQSDPNEWTNLAGDAPHTKTKKDLGVFLDRFKRTPRAP